MTIRNMGSRRGATLCAWGLVLVLLAACGDSGGGDTTPAAADPRLDKALSQISSIQRTADGLAARVERLENRRDHMTERIDNLAARLGSALSDLRESLRARVGAADEAAATANDALNRAQSALDGLSVLENRFDYHMKHDHGGG
ncbi:MAG TPA: hypothetical protein VFK89_08570 [Actinomycetota bacterium]|nr:hypothetical protein [Actinomycetota bacterium]